MKSRKEGRRSLPSWKDSQAMKRAEEHYIETVMQYDPRQDLLLNPPDDYETDMFNEQGKEATDGKKEG